MLDCNLGLSVTVDSLMVPLVNRIFVTRIVQLGMRYVEDIYPTLSTKQIIWVRKHSQLFLKTCHIKVFS